MAEQNTENQQPTQEEQLVAEYLERIRKIMEGDDTVTIGDMIVGSKRLENETREEYKARLKAENLISSHYRKGIRFATNS